MAQRFVRQARRALNPGYRQQTQALQSQIPAINQLYDSLQQGLMAQQESGNLQIFENAANRGVLNSTIPVDEQTGLAGQIIQQQGQYAAEQAQDIGNIQAQIGQIGIDRAQAIADYVNQLKQRQLAQQQFNFTRQQSNRQFRLDRRLANRQYQLDRQAVYY